MITISLFTLTSLLGFALAHGGHEQQPIPADADWATRHMAGKDSPRIATI